MPEQSDNSPLSNQKIPVPGEDNTDPAKVQSPRLEELLLDQDDSDPIDALIEREVTSVTSERKFSTWTVFLLFLTLLMAIGLFGAVYMLYFHFEQPPPLVTETVVNEVRQPIPDRPLLVQPQESHQETAEATDRVDASIAETSLPAVEVADLLTPLPMTKQQDLYTLVVGPFINNQSLVRAEQALAELGMQTEQQPGRGMVPMYRLLEGVYAPGEAKKRLKVLSRVANSAFLLPQKENMALYAGSFVDQERALLFQLQLQQQQVDVALVQVEVAMEGTSLVALKTDKETAQQLAGLIEERGLEVQVTLDK